ncbi:MAG TPA: glycosyl transferase family 1, partial [candidate division WOR-3 bacterium]|nr:glycosyl transferase family 1 [candidate division WOR-3 bacterium]
MKHLEDYREIVGDNVITEIYRKARKLYGRHIVHINSTFMGGGVAEMLLSIAPLMNYIGLNADWVTFHGNQDFFTLTKKIHNALQGDRIHWTKNKVNLYLNTNRNFSIYTHLGENYDLVIIHDPQPLPLIRFYKKVQPWVWRCHVDLSHPNETVWNFLKNFILRYDLVIVSNEKYKNDIPIKYKIIHPA